MKRKVDAIIIHCSASDAKSADNIATMRKWHKARGWSDVGYNFFIRKDGTVEEGRHLDKIPAHAKGWNKRAIGICLHGLKEDKFTQHQFDACARLIRELREEHGLKVDIYGHRQVANKSCPVFDMYEIYKRLY